MKLAVENGITSLVLRVFIQNSASTTGAGLTGLTHASSGMIIALIADNEATATLYTVAASNVETITTLGTFAAPTSNKCRFKEVDATNLPGVYELHFANARWAVSGARSVQGMISGASGAVACPFEVQLADVPANVTKFGGTAAIMSAGVPEVKVQSIANNAITAASIAADVAIEISTQVASDLATVHGSGSWTTATGFATPANVTDAVTSIKGSDGDTLESLSDQIDGLSTGTGTGARTVTITVNDGTTVLENARVRLTEGANTYTGLTNVSGVVTFNLDDATYTVGITKSGYSYAGTTLVVDGTETRTYSMTLVSLPEPSTPDKTVLTILCLDNDGDAVSAVNVSIRYTAIPTGSEDIAFPGGTITKTSNVNGIASFEVIKGATIEYKRGTRDVWIEALMSDEDNTSITSFIGTP